MSHAKICLNCENPISGKFCNNCGQKTDTHRITLKHFVTHDILHGIWHIERGILFTLKEAMLRPGRAALDYIKGKRVRYYNVFYLILILIGIIFFINSIYDKLAVQYFNITSTPEMDSSGRSMDAFLSNYSKLIIFSFVPIFAFNSFILFKRKKLNVSEHFIIAGMIFLGVMVIAVISELLYFTDFLKYIDVFGRYLNMTTPIVILVYVLLNYYRTFKEEYKTSQIFLKSFLFLLMLIVELSGLLLLLVGYFTHWTFTMKLAY